MGDPFDPVRPFALLRDEAAGAWHLLDRLQGSIEARGADGVADALAAIRNAEGWLAGGLCYEAGLAMEPRLAPRVAADALLVWLGRFAGHRLLDDAAVAALVDALPPRAAAGAAAPLIDEAAFAAAVAETQARIAAGDLYQANLTFPARVPVSGHPLVLFWRLWRAGRPPLAAAVHRGGGRWWLSLSPELMVRLHDGALVARPMKGTARRQADPDADAKAAAALAADAKNRAENLMITDLIRHDLARVAVPGTVRVPQLFALERYASVHQLTSTVVGCARAGVGAADLVAALFPCGSVTGAPKIRAMEVIDGIEGRRRGIYCGSIGWVAPGGACAAFNVAIRTLDLAPDDPGAARLGLGAGIVADSVAADEWAECLAKAGFLAAQRPAALIETMRRRADGSVDRLARHLDRLAASAGWFGWPFDAAATAARLASLPPAPADQRLRLLLGESGTIAAELSPAPAHPPMPWRVALAPLPLAADDWRLAHKTDQRQHWPPLPPGIEEWLFTTPCGRLTEGSRTSLFVERGGRLLTPPRRCGLLPGVLRAELLDTGMAAEAELGVADLEGGFFLGSSLRGLLPARLAAPAPAA